MSMKLGDYEAVALESLVGLRDLDAVDESTKEVEQWGHRYEQCQVMRLRLDGKVYAAFENPDDGYRSSMGKFIHFPNAKMTNVFPPVRVLARVRTQDRYSGESEVLELLDVANGKVILEVGTEHTDDYYPSFVASWNPKNLNTHIGAIK